MKASAQVSVGSVGVVGVVVEVVVGAVVWVGVVDVVVGEPDSDLLFGGLGRGGRLLAAATDLQKRVLRGEERHCLHVPGPFTQGSVVGAGLVGF